MSVHAQPAELDALMKLGADGFMTKPFTWIEPECLLQNND